MEDNIIQRLALKAVRKNWSYDDVKYGDDLYGHENDVELVMTYVDECKQIGIAEFCSKYGLN